MDRGIGRGETWNAWIDIGDTAEARERHSYRFGIFNRTNSAFSSIQIRQFHPDTFLTGKSWRIYATDLVFKARLVVICTVLNAVWVLFGERGDTSFSPLFSCRFSRIFLNKRDMPGI